MDLTTETEALTDFTGRAAGTDAERRAAGHLRARLERLGHAARVETVQTRPRNGLMHVAHALLAIVGGIAAVESPELGAALVGVALVSTVLDVTGFLGRPVRRLTPRRASQNVVAGERTGRPGLLVIAAHIDAAREAPAFVLARRALRDPWRAEAIAIAVVSGCCLARVAGLDSTALTAVQFVPTVVLILLLPAFADIELSGTDPDPGAAAAAAAATALYDGIEGSLDHFDVQLVLTGASAPFGLGMAAWLRANESDLRAERTAVIVLDRLGSGELRFARRQGAIFSRAAHPDLVRLCGQIAQDAGPGGARSGVHRQPADGAAARSQGLPALTVWCDGGSSSPDSALRTLDFCRELARRLDADVGPRLSHPSRPEPAAST